MNRCAVLQGLAPSLGCNAQIALDPPHRAHQHAQAAPAAMGMVFAQKITSRFRIMAGSAAFFIAKCRSTNSLPNTLLMYPFIMPPNR